jgi:hypothetical protein
MQALQEDLPLLDALLLALHDIAVHLDALRQPAQGQSQLDRPLDVLRGIGVGVVRVIGVLFDIVLDEGELLADELGLLEQLLQLHRLH